MTKLHLFNTTSGKTEAFETVDAKEILETPGTIYTLVDPQPVQGPIVDALLAGIRVPQMHGEQSGTSRDRGISKYARAALTKDAL